MNFNEARKIAVHLAKFQKEIEAMTTVMGVEAKNHFKKSFNDGGFTDNSLTSWQKRKRSRDNVGRAILVKTGRLKRSIDYRKRSKIGNNYSVIIQTNVPYAKIHNEGGVFNKKARKSVLNFNEKGGFQRQRTVRQRANTSYSQKVSIGAHAIKIPKRQFIGNSFQLNQRIIKKLDSKIRTIFA